VACVNCTTCSSGVVISHLAAVKHVNVVASATAGVVVGAGRLANTSAPQHPISPNNLNTPLVVLVETHALYLVLVLTLQAVACWQFLLTRGYNVAVSPPIVINTGAVIVVSAGIVCAITMQYFSLLK
jgi:hypothetical protein